MEGRENAISRFAAAYLILTGLPAILFIILILVVAVKMRIVSPAYAAAYFFLIAAIAALLFPVLRNMLKKRISAMPGRKKK